MFLQSSTLVQAVNQQLFYEGYMVDRIVRIVVQRPMQRPCPPHWLPRCGTTAGLTAGRWRLGPCNGLECQRPLALVSKNFSWEPVRCRVAPSLQNARSAPPRVRCTSRLARALRLASACHRPRGNYYGFSGLVRCVRNGIITKRRSIPCLFQCRSRSGQGSGRWEVTAIGA